MSLYEQFYHLLLLMSKFSERRNQSWNCRNLHT